MDVNPASRFSTAKAILPESRTRVSKAFLNNPIGEVHVSLEVDYIVNEVSSRAEFAANNVLCVPGKRKQHRNKQVLHREPCRLILGTAYTVPGLPFKWRQLTNGQEIFPNLIGD